jgi:glycosyltransferase involved in cell wall biosynthesis
MAAHSQYRVHVVSGNLESVPSHRSLELLADFVRHVRMAIDIIRNRDHAAIVLTKFKTPFLPVLMALTFPWARKVFLVTHHTMQQAINHSSMRPVLRTAARLGYGFLLFETDEFLTGTPLESVEIERVAVIPEPGPHSSWWPTDEEIRPTGDVPIVGVVGEWRAEKGASLLIAELKAIREGSEQAFEILVAARNVDDFPPGTLDGVRVIETPDMAAYCSALRACDVVAINHDERRYLHRSSGVLTDAVIFGCAAVAPGYPIFRHQLTHPERIGEPFVALSGLGEALNRALDLRRSGVDPFRAHRDLRRPEALAEAFDRQFATLG